MKKQAVFAFATAITLAVFAQESSLPDSDVNLDTPEETTVVAAQAQREFAEWPAFFAIYEFPEAQDVVGIRITVPYSTKQESITGFDFGLWGRSQYFEGVQINLARNDVKDRATGIQFGLYNSISQADSFALQMGLWNESSFISGGQLGFVNMAGDMTGIQIGIINRCEAMYGIQFGIVNVIRAAEVQFFPIVNIGF